MFAFLKTLHNLSWKTAIAPRDYLWAYIKMVPFSLGSLAGIGGVAYLASMLAANSQILAIGVGALLGLPLLALLFWLLWVGLKLTANRVHDLGFRFRWFVVFWLAVFLMVPILTALLLKVMPFNPLWVIFFKSAVGIVHIWLLYVLYFEKGPEKVPFERTDVLHTPCAWWRTALVALFCLFVFGQPVAEILFNMFLI